VFSSWYSVRCSLLTTGAALGVDSVRCAEGDGMMENRQTGYTISRNDVGLYMFEKIVVPYQKEDRVGKFLNLTY
jgi:hypothetical protein